MLFRTMCFGGGLTLGLGGRASGRAWSPTGRAGEVAAGGSSCGYLGSCDIHETGRRQAVDESCEIRKTTPKPMTWDLGFGEAIECRDGERQTRIERTGNLSFARPPRPRFRGTLMVAKSRAPLSEDSSTAGSKCWCSRTAGIASTWSTLGRARALFAANDGRASEHAYYFSSVLRSGNVYRRTQGSRMFVRTEEE